MTAPTAHHVGITVRDLDESLAFYRDALGLEVIDRFTVSGEGFATGVGVPGAEASFVHLDGGGTRIELVAYHPEGDPVAETAVNRPGATHVGLEVADVDDVDATLPASVPRVSDPQTTESGARILFVRDPDGTLVELIEPAE